MRRRWKAPAVSALAAVVGLLGAAAPAGAHASGRLCGTIAGLRWTTQAGKSGSTWLVSTISRLTCSTARQDGEYIFRHNTRLPTLLQHLANSPPGFSCVGTGIHSGTAIEIYCSPSRGGPATFKLKPTALP